MTSIEQVLRPVMGVPSWLVRTGHGSFVTLEFGEPKVEFGEPKMSRLNIEGGPPQALRRNARVHGEWHLWLYCCYWLLAVDGAPLAHNESDDVTIARALRLLNGQAITDVSINPDDGATTFSFDLGCVLSTKPAAAGAYDIALVEQWLLYQPSGDVLTVRSDGMFDQRPGTLRSTDRQWKPLPSLG